MSEKDRQKWNARYAAGAYAERRQPSAILSRALAAMPSLSGRALDVACGAGRNALYLAACGFAVDAIDISSEALVRAREQATLKKLPINWIERDLSEPADLTRGYQLIVMVRYVNARLLDDLVRALSPGGLLVVEQHLQLESTDPAASRIIGPKSSRFRVRPGELIAAVSGLRIIESAEGLLNDPDGREVALASVIAQRI